MTVNAETNEILTRIARQELGVETLDRRWSDSLDFYGLAVWQIREALKAAFEAGAQQAKHREVAP